MKVNVNNIDLYYEVSGKGPALIMLHGNGEDHSIFNKAKETLNEYFTVYAIDTRGHGQSSAVSEYHYDDMVDDIYAFIHELRLQKPIIYGFSDGAIIGLLLAARYPDLLTSLIASGANTTPDGIRDGWHKFFIVLQKLVKDPKVEMMNREPNITKDMLGSIKIPVLVTAGSHDLVKRSDTEFIANSISNSTMNIVKGKGHGSYIVNKKDIADMIIDFYKRECQ